MNFKQFIKDNDGFAHQRALKEFYYQLCSDALELTGNNTSKAAELTGMSRTTFLKWARYSGVAKYERTAV